MTCSRTAAGIALTCATLAAVAVTAAPAAAAAPSPAATVSGPSPVPQTGSLCSPVAGPVGRHNYEYQPSLAISPGGGHRMAVAWAQDYDDAVVVAISDDGGATWRQSVPGWDGRDPSSSTGFMACENGPTGRNSAHNPHIAVGKDGIVYAMADLLPAAGPQVEVILSSSADGGSTWRTRPLAHSTECAATQPMDGSDCSAATVGWTAIAVDPKRSGVAYAAWDIAVGDSTTGFTTGTEYVTSTTDGGLNWSKPVAIGPLVPNRGWSGGTLLVRPDGSVLDVFSDCPPVSTVSTLIDDPCSSDSVVRLVTSFDGGQSWTTSVEVTPRGALNRVADAALSPDGSEVYVAWFNGYREGLPFLSRSVNGGPFTTTAVTKVPGTVQTLNVTVATDGTVGLLYNDRRNADGDHLNTDAWLARSHDHGTTFAETHVAGPFDIAATSPAGVGGVGEYQGLRGVPDGFALAYTRINPTGVSDQPVMGYQSSSLVNPNPSDIVFSRFPS